MASGSRENPLQLAQFSFSAGLDEGTRDEIVEAGAAWLVLENGRQDQVGGYSTRTGFSHYVANDTNGLPTSTYKIFSDGDTLVRVCDGISARGPVAQIYSATQGQWVTVGDTVPFASCRLRNVASVGTSTGLEDVDQCNGVIALSWLSGSQAYLAVIDQATGAVLRAPEPVGAALVTPFPTLFAHYGTLIVAARLDTATHNLNTWVLDTGDISTGWVADVAMATDAAAGAYVLESLSFATVPSVAVIYINRSGGTNRVTVTTWHSGAVLATQTIATTSITPSAISMCSQGGAAGDYLWLTWNENATVKACALNPSNITATALGATTSVITMATGCSLLGIASGATAHTARIVANDTNAAMQMRVNSVTGVGTLAAGTQVIVPAVNSVSRPFTYGARYYGTFIAADTANLQSTIVVADFTVTTTLDTFLRPVANPAPGLSVLSTSLAARCAAETGAGKFFAGIGTLRSGVTTGASLVELDFNSSTRWQSVAFGSSTYLTGGVAGCFDGTRLAEIGFLFRPAKPTTTFSGTGITAVTGWRYVAVYEEVDSDGNWHQSGISDPSASTGAITNQTVFVTTTPLAISSRLSSSGANATSVRVALYRTLDGGVAPYYRLDVIANDTSSTTLTYSDGISDTVLAANAKLYEQPGVIGTSQDKRPPPFFSCLTSYNGCLVGASGSDVWYSGQGVTGEGVWFNPVFQVPVPGDGDITALWVMDGTLFIAKRREMYAIAGEAPSDNGASGGLGLPRRLAVDVGCIEPRSVCVTAFGTFFQSDRGIEILTRAQSVQWIGPPVQETLAAFPIVTSATVEPVSCTVLIECAASQASGLVTGGGRTLVFDLSLQKWVSTDRRTSSAGTVDAPSQSACMIFTGTDYRYAWLTTNGIVHYGNDTHIDANGAIVAKRAVSANVRLSGLQGLQHVNKTLLLAKYHTPHDLEMSFAYDYSSTYTTARLYTAAQLAALAAVLPNMQLQDDMSNDARCEAVRVQLQDATPSSGTLGTGQGSTWIALSLEIVPQTGAYQLPDASR